MPKKTLTEEEWQAAGDEFVASLPPLTRTEPREKTHIELVVQAFFRAAGKKAPQPKARYHPLTGKKY